MRLTLTPRTALAASALRFLSAQPRRQRAGAVAAAIGSSAAYVPKLLGPLVRLGYVDSTVGPRGGYRLTVQGLETSLLDLILAVEGPIELPCCLLDATRHDACAHHAGWRAAADRLLLELGTARVCDPVVPRELLPGAASTGPRPARPAPRREDAQTSPTEGSVR